VLPRAFLAALAAGVPASGDAFPAFRFLLPAGGCLGTLSVATALPALADAPLAGVADACLAAGLLPGVAAGLTGVVFMAALGDGDGGADAITSARLRSRFAGGRPAGR
jgi:hypothetical protein